MFFTTAHRHLEAQQQLTGLRQHGLVQREQQHDEPGGAERRAERAAGPEPGERVAGRAGEAAAAAQPRRAGAHERRLARLLALYHGTGHMRVRHPQAPLQVLLVLRPQPQDRRRPHQHDLRAGQVAAARRGDRLHRGGDAHVRRAPGALLFLLELYAAEKKSDSPRFVFLRGGARALPFFISSSFSAGFTPRACCWR